MINILFFIHDLGMGGAEKALVNLVNNMDRTKFRITVKPLFDIGVNRKFLKPHILYQPVFKRLFPANTQMLKLLPPSLLYKIMVRDKYNLVVSFLEGPSARIISGCRDQDTKKVTWIHPEHQTMKILAYAFRSSKEAIKCYNSFDTIVCISNTVRDDFVSILNFKKPVTILHNVNETLKIIEMSQVKPDDEEFSDYKGLKLCAVGKITPNKGIMELAHIHRRLLADGIEHHFYILGEGPQRKEIEEFSQNNRLTNSFILLGYQDNPYQYVARCDLLISASKHEGFSTAVTEALIVGTPVVAAICSGMKELLGEHNEYGIVTENNDESLYLGIKRMLTEPGLLTSYKERAAMRGKEFSMEKTVNAVESFFLNLLGRDVQ